MTKKCFVIMPYGSADEERRRRFLGVYQSVILPAATQAGYECKRSDMAAEPGNITHDIVRDLVDADIVIADLTEANANVFFELGVRHAVKKSGTVHIIDRDHKLPFDIQQYRTIEYSVHLADIPDAINAIVSAIQKREKSPERPDNPVHDAIPELPLNLLATGDSVLRNQLKSSEQYLEEARTELAEVKKKLSQFDPVGTLLSGNIEVDVDLLLDQADEIMQFTGQHALLKLKQAIDGGGADAFTKELRQVLKSPYLDENDFAEIVLLCKQLSLYAHRRATLDVAISRYPNSQHMFLALVDALDDSPNPADLERGRKLLEDRLGIVYDHGKPILKNEPVDGQQISTSSIGLLFNFYNRANKSDWVISIADQLTATRTLDGGMLRLVLRNRARALAKQNRKDEAKAEFERALEADPTDDQTLVWYSELLVSTGDLKGAYELSERAIVADPEDSKLFIHLAIQIFNMGFCRNEEGHVVGPFPKDVARAYGVPLVVEAVRRGQSLELLEEAVRILVRAGATDVASELSKGRVPNKEKFKQSALEYVLRKIDAQFTGQVLASGG